MDWLVPVLIGMLCALVGVVYYSLQDRIKAIEKQIGDREHGIIGDLHKNRNRSIKFRSSLLALAEKIGFDISKYLGDDR